MPPTHAVSQTWPAHPANNLSFQTMTSAPGKVPRVHDEELIGHDEEFTELLEDQELADDEAEMSEQDANGHTLSIRRADGTEVVTVSTLGSGQQWSVYMQPGGGVQNAYLGGQSSPRVWVTSDEHKIARDEDGTYFICID
jgi:hypothetical protein